MRQQGVVFILSGPSGSGKTTLARRVLESFKERAAFSRSISYTTRRARAGEREGKDYHFISSEEFLRLRRAKKFLEWTRYLGYYYATSRAFVEAELTRGRNIVLCLDFQGVRQIKEHCRTRVVSIFIIPPSLEELRTRINRRSKTSTTEVSRRLSMARKELAVARKYDYCIVNSDLKTAARLLTELIQGILKIE